MANVNTTDTEYSSISQDYEYDLAEPSSKKNVLYILRLKVNSVTYYLYTRSFGSGRDEQVIFRC